MKAERQDETTHETTGEALNGTQPHEPHRSTLFALPAIPGPETGFDEKQWQDILLMIGGLPLEAEMLLTRPPMNPKSKTAPTAPFVTIVVNTEGANLLTVTEASEALRAVFSTQMTMRSSNPPSNERSTGTPPRWVRMQSTMLARDVINDAVGELRATHKAGLTPINQAVWYRVDKTWTLERAIVDLGADAAPIVFEPIENAGEDFLRRLVPQPRKRRRTRSPRVRF